MIDLTDADFDIFFTRLCSYVMQKTIPPSGGQAAWPHIPVAEREILIPVQADWSAAYAKTKVPHSPVDTEAKNLAKAAAKKVIRSFVNRFLREEWEAVTPMDREYLGIPNRDTHPTPVPRPEDVPEVEALLPLPRVLHFRFRRANMKRWGKPQGVHGVELLWLISDTPPADVEELVHSSFATKSPLELVFKESERGKRLYYAARWETGTVKKGNLSDIFSVFIP